MAASTYIPAPAAAPFPRALAAAAAARTAPRGDGLAPVVPLPLAERGAVRVGTPHAPAPLRMLPTPVPNYARRRIVALLVLVGIVAAVVLGVMGLAGSASADPAEPAVVGHVVLQPGETLWDVAVRSAPAGVDPRQQLDVLRRLNGFGPGGLDAWTVVLIPAP